MTTSASIEVGRPPAEVFAYVIDPSRFTEWQEGIVDGHVQSDRPQRIPVSQKTSTSVARAARTTTGVSGQRGQALRVTTTIV